MWIFKEEFSSVTEPSYDGEEECMGEREPEASFFLFDLGFLKRPEM